MNIAVFSVTEHGRFLSLRMAEGLVGHSVKRFCFYQHTDDKAEAFDKISAQTAAVFAEFDALIFLCACGIAVRSIAPHVQSKVSDPAVLVIDDGGRFVIPILSGHLGGANALAEVAADILGAVPVITTATDVGKRFSPDSFAAANDLLITDLTAAKNIAAAVLAGEKIGLYSDYPYRNKPDELAEDLTCHAGICISDDASKHPFPVTLLLIPRNIVIGIGCKRGTSETAIARTVKEAFAHAHLSEERICAVASIDLKAEEYGLQSFCKKRELPFHTYSAETLAAAKGTFTASAFVRDTTGVDNVCERSAAVCSQGELILKKYAQDGVTVAAAASPVQLDFHRRRSLF